MDLKRGGQLILWLGAALFFTLGLVHPIMGSKLFFRFTQPDIYLWTSIADFYRSGDWFLASLLLLFTFIFPILKWVYLGWACWSKKEQGPIHWWLELINKWAMLDVFVVAVILVNLKGSSIVIITSLEAGITYFALSVLCLQGLSFWLARINATT